MKKPLTFQIILLWGFTLFLPFLSIGQPANDGCGSVEMLCPDQQVSGTTIDATADTCSGCEDDTTSTNAFCYQNETSVWYQFSTNDNGGNASINVQNIQCLSGQGLQAVVLEAGTPCDPSTYNSVSNCQSGTMNDFSLNASGMAPNTNYWIHLDGENADECNFTVEVSGEAVEFLADTLVTDQDCGNSLGEIEVTNVSGGTSPYSYSLDGGPYQGSNTFGGLTTGYYTISVKDDNGCEQTVLQNVHVGQTGAPDVGTVDTNSATCTGNDGEIHLTDITGSGPPYDFDLNGDVTQTDSSFTGVDPGIHQIIVTDASGCKDTVNNIIVENEDGITNATTTTTPSDCGLNNGSAEATSVTDGTGPFSYQWDDPNNQTTQTAMDLPGGSYDVTITDDNGCTFTVNNVSVQELPPDTAEISITSTPNPSCEGDDVTFTAQTTNGGSNASVDWYENGVLVQNGGNSYNNSNLSSGDVVQAELVTNDPCVYPDTAVSNAIQQVVQQEVQPTLQVAADKTQICDNEKVNFTIDTANAGKNPTITCYNNGSEVYSGQATNFTGSGFSNGDQVHCEITPSEPCTQTAYSDSLEIGVTEFSGGTGPDKVIGEGDKTQLEATGGDSYMWSPTSSLNNPGNSDPTASPKETTTYFVDITYQGCDTTLQQTVKVIKLIRVPNTFTPNGDGYNDKWTIQRIEKYPNCKVTVYDRWGQRVFHSIGYTDSQRWDGTKNGNKIPTGTYYYVIDLNREEGDGKNLFKGTISIVH